MLAEELIEKRKNRAIAIVMKVKEREVDPLLTGAAGEAAKRALRKAIIDMFNDLGDMAKDVAMSGEAAKTWFNDEVWEERLTAAVKAGVGQAMQGYDLSED